MRENKKRQMTHKFEARANSYSFTTSRTKKAL